MRGVRSLPTALLLLLLLPLCVLSCRWLQAELLFWQTSALFADWETRETAENWYDNSGALTLVEWEDAERRLARARALRGGPGFSDSPLSD